MSVCKCMYLWKWNRMSMIDDNLLTKLLTRFNLMFSVFPAIIRLILKEQESNFHLQFVASKNVHFKVCMSFEKKFLKTLYYT